MEDVSMSVLSSIKKMLGIIPEYDVFDYDISIHIRNCFMVLYELGVKVSDTHDVETETWEEVFEGYEDFLTYIKDYVYLKVRLLFDPPSTSSVATSYESQISEMEWRIRMYIEDRFIE